MELLALSYALEDLAIWCEGRGLDTTKLRRIIVNAAERALEPNQNPDPTLDLVPEGAD